MTHYNPIAEAESSEPTVAELCRQYDVEVEPQNHTLTNAQAALAAALHDIGSQTMDDTAKWNAVQAILEAMLTLDRYGNMETVITTEEKQMYSEEYDMEYTATEVGVRVSQPQ